MSAINIYFYLLMISDYEGDVVTLCNIIHVNVGYKYLLLFTYDVDVTPLIILKLIFIRHIVCEPIITKTR